MRGTAKSTNSVSFLANSKDCIRALRRRMRKREIDAVQTFRDGLARELLKLAALIEGASIHIYLDDPNEVQSENSNRELLRLASVGKNFDAELARKAYEKGSRQFAGKSRVAVPIRVRNSAVGVLEVERTIGASGIDKKTLGVIEVFADYVAAFFQNALDILRTAESAKLDPLTGLYNEREFFRILRQSVAQVSKAASAPGKSVAVVFVDLDYFKQVNDKYGHLAGSRVLWEVAELFREVVYETFKLSKTAKLARYGGDEFVFVFSGGAALASEVAEACRARLANHAFLSEKKLRGKVTASAGVAVLSSAEIKGGARDATHWVNELVHRADQAMYKAKQQGRNRIVEWKKSVTKEVKREQSERRIGNV